MHTATVSLGDDCYFAGSYEHRDHADLAQNVVRLLLERFKPGDAAVGEAAAAVPRALRDHPSVRQLLASATLDDALWNLPRGGRIANMAASLGSQREATPQPGAPTAGSSPNRRSHPDRGPSSHSTPDPMQEDEEDEEESMEERESDDDEEALQLLTNLAASAPAPRPGSGSRHTKSLHHKPVSSYWVESPQGSGAYAVAISRQNFPVRMVLPAKQPCESGN